MYLPGVLVRIRTDNGFSESGIQSFLELACRTIRFLLAEYQLTGTTKQGILLVVEGYVLFYQNPLNKTCTPYAD